MNQPAIDKTAQFVQDQFMKYPHHSFGDGSVMYIHSRNVMDTALQLCSDDSDKTVIAIAALLHDIGKTFSASDDVLHKHHQDYNVEMSQELMAELDITPQQKRQIVEVISEKSNTRNSEIIRNADMVAFCIDRHLQNLFIDWALSGNRTASINKKLSNLSRLSIPKAVELATPGYYIMKVDWESKGVNIDSCH